MPNNRDVLNNQANENNLPFNNDPIEVLNEPDAQANPIFEQPNPQQVANDDNHWNPMEWDRAAEDLTWDRVSSYVYFRFLN